MRFEDAFKDLSASYGHLHPDEAEEVRREVEDLRTRIVTLAQRGRDAVAVAQCDGRMSADLAEALRRLELATARLDLDGRTLRKGKSRRRRAEVPT